MKHEVTLLELVMKEELRRIDLEISKLDGTYVNPTPRNELAESQYVTQREIHSGPEYLEVRSRLWPTPSMTVDNKPIKNLEEARKIAYRQGLKGVTIKFESSE